MVRESERGLGDFDVMDPLLRYVPWTLGRLGAGPG